MNKKDLESFSYFGKPITEVSDNELIRWLISFLNGADYNDPMEKMEYGAFKAECSNRGEEFNKKVDYLTSVI